MSIIDAWGLALSSLQSIIHVWNSWRFIHRGAILDGSLNERESEQWVVGLSISMATCIVGKEKNYFSVRHSFITQKKNCSTHRRPQRAWRRLTSDLNRRVKESSVDLLMTLPPTLASTLQSQPRYTRLKQQACVPMVEFTRCILWKSYYSCH